MAATRIIPLHIGKEKTIAKALNDRLDYSQNPDKTDDRKYVSSYECDPETAAEKFALSKKEYYRLTGRSHEKEVIAYQIRQSFKPGEITPEEANRVGYETAMRFTKGKHAFTVSTHTDRAHIHNHIIFNSTTLDCKHKFRNFLKSGLALEVFSEYKAMHYSNQYLEEHREEITSYRAAQDIFRKYKIEKLPKVKPFRRVYADPFREKSGICCLQKKKQQMQELLKAQKNVEMMLDIKDEKAKQKETDRTENAQR